MRYDINNPDQYEKVSKAQGGSAQCYRATKE
jgi:hypothetical protein